MGRLAGFSCREVARRLRTFGGWRTLWVSVLQRVRVFFLSRRIRSARAAQTALRRMNQAPQGLIDRLLIRKVLRNVRRKQHEIRSRSKALHIFAADPAIQFRQVILSPQFVPPNSFLSFFLHIVFARAPSSFAR